MSLLCFTAAHALVQFYLVVEVVYPDENDTVLRLVRVITYFVHFRLFYFGFEIYSSPGESRGIPFLCEIFRYVRNQTFNFHYEFVFCRRSFIAALCFAVDTFSFFSS